MTVDHVLKAVTMKISSLRKGMMECVLVAVSNWWEHPQLAKIKKTFNNFKT